MCAIFGVVGEYDAKQAKAAFDRLTHRGVDESTVLEKSGMFAGVHRLAITGTHLKSTQPYEAEGVTLLFNGEIYNYQELAKMLGMGEAASEVAVLHAAYLAWGDVFVEHLRGMYAIAIIEKESVKLFRDPFGKKPLFYSREDDRFIFASELKAIHLLKSMHFNKKILPQYLSYQSAISPYTFDAHTLQVGAGYGVTYDVMTKTVTTKCFYDPLEVNITLHDKEEAVKKIEEKLLESVSLRLPKEVKCAALLSGGLDSSLIAAMVAKHGTIDTFSIGYEGYESYDERPYARITAKHIGSKHHEVSFGREDFLQNIEELLEILDEPLADPAMIPLYYLMKQIRSQGFKVVLTGDGSDELFMGYKTYKEFFDLGKASDLQFKNWLRNYFKSHFSMHKEWEWYKRVFEGTTLFRSTAEVFTDLQQNRLLRMNVRDNHSLEAIGPYVEAFEKSGRTSSVDWYSFLDLKVMLGEVFLRKLDRVSMAHSIEARSPFLDKEVVATAFACDPSLRMSDSPKALIKAVAQDYLPSEIIHRKKKGFSYPFMQWLMESGELEVIERVQKHMALFHEDELQDLLAKGRQGMFKQHIFSLYMLCKWLQKQQI